MILVILSAGRGSRLKHHTQNVPKSLVRIKNIPIIDYMERFRNKFQKTIIVTGYKNKLIKNKFKIKYLIRDYQENIRCILSILEK